MITAVRKEAEDWDKYLSEFQDDMGYPVSYY